MKQSPSPDDKVRTSGD